MIRSEEMDLRDGLVYDPYVKRYDSSFWQGDTANLGFDTVKNVIKIIEDNNINCVIESKLNYCQRQ